MPLMPQPWPPDKAFEPDKWFSELNNRNAQLKLGPADQLQLAELLEKALKVFSLQGSGFVGPATRIRRMGAFV
jgi:hypothetical protein